VPIMPSPDELLVVSGEILWLLSGGRIRPIHHQVRPVAFRQERMSVLFFADLHPSLCQPWVVNQTNYHIDIGERVLKNATRFGLTEWKFE
jgi:isopenicillin N synthase-like dioxygenase